MISVSSPGRICLFGEHQDYLGLPVIAAAVSVRVAISAVANSEGVFRIDMPDIGGVEVIDPRIEQQYASKRDYLRSALNVIKRKGYFFDKGYDIKLTSGIPIGKGCSSSSAMLVAWMAMLSKLSTDGEPLSPQEAALLAYHAEVKEFGEPGGMMDHFTSAEGGIVHIKTKGDITVTPMNKSIEGSFILGDSLVQKDTTGVLGSVRSVATEGLELVKESLPEAEWETVSMRQAEDILQGRADRVAKCVTGNIRNRDITRKAMELFSADVPDSEALGGLLHEEHHILSGSIGISTPKIDGMVEAAMNAGAWGAKINGSGGGGCMFAFADSEKAEDVARAITSAGGAAIKINIDNGLSYGRQ